MFLLFTIMILERLEPPLANRISKNHFGFKKKSFELISFVGNFALI